MKTSNYEALQFDISLGPVSTTIQVLNVEGKSHSHGLRHMSSTFASIFMTDSKMGEIAIKCFHFN